MNSNIKAIWRSALVTILLIVAINFIPTQFASALGGQYKGLKLPCPAGIICKVTRGGAQHGTGRHAVDFTLTNKDFPAIHAGTVYFSGLKSNGGGYQLWIDHSDNYCSVYYHLTQGKLYVKAGDNVLQGQIIAQSGCTGNCTGPHLHLAVIQKSGGKCTDAQSNEIAMAFDENPNRELTGGDSFVSQNYLADFGDLTKDINGDGKADIVGIAANNERFVAWTSKGSAFNGGAEWLNGPYDYSAYQFRSADVNGDGKADIVGIAANEERFVVWTSKGSGFNDGVEWLNGPYDYSAYQFRVADVNGDGKADIVGIAAKDERFVVWTSKGSGFNNGVEWLNGPYDYSAYRLYVADVNGDGKADIVGIAANEERFVVWTSKGSAFNGGAEWLNGPYDYSAYQFRVADVNGDGKGDIVGIAANNERFVVWTSKGSGFNNGVEWLNGPYDYSAYRF